jgi:hypothetical protein
MQCMGFQYLCQDWKMRKGEPDERSCQRGWERDRKHERYTNHSFLLAAMEPCYRANELATQRTSATSSSSHEIMRISRRLLRGGPIFYLLLRNRTPRQFEHWYLRNSAYPVMRSDIDVPVPEGSASWLGYGKTGQYSKIHDDIFIR